MWFHQTKNKYDIFRVAVMAIIFNEKGEVLLAHRTDKDMWNLPGGKLEKREAPWEGLKREVREEVGVEVDIERLVGIYSYQNNDHDMLVLPFVCKIVSGELKNTPETDKIAYYPPNALPENIYHRQPERIKDALAQTTHAVLKSQK